ncbi:peptidoglycan hydrolase-like protein with peptidoglycan-binding domain [Actinoplanes tereljensis]|uniref:Peptidoglycan-binding protein n=1 Tax=Paractinoplanes tereljensis TaxID=571912 RepID=A0A919TQA1_9ACTN|nr:peptidoglycan-binding protein [Actinoplanes tereljensis]GIF18903.1 peptidoglycan-binding protein [Actinoplanes tereljensis]
MSARRTAGIVAGVVAVGAVATAVTVFNLPDPSGNSAGASDNTTPTTAEIARETLVDRETHDGTLGHGLTSTLAAKSNGTVTWLPNSGALVKRGQTLYKIDNKPVVLLYGTLPSYRTLAPGVKGADVKQFEKNLWALGYRGFTVDSTYSSSTAAAVEDWQDDLGLSETGRVETSQIAYAATAIRVDSVTAENGSAAMSGTELLKYAGTVLVATVKMTMASQRLAKPGAAVQVEMPDGKKINGKIIKVGTTVQEGQGDQPDTTLLEVTIGFSGAPTGLDEASVAVYFTSSERKNVLTVPVGALLALAEGGYGVQVVDGSTTRIVAVETGLFADGKVEVTGPGLEDGTKVGVPA